ncbi:hypothetical protein psal_cds_344 [Pandoravirus salinus]|uniref:Uncharacterized protein n=1 Tax=Pandoravirus salinus TaxID=1349410 RepID=S4VX31_9VIRU|nr:hypothetical protein psal_cds_344 [Pandoravirus salinus]AGO83986.1 hypothetical protein psal_cds_344 [Pandoravirus salinus]
MRRRHGLGEKKISDPTENFKKCRASRTPAPADNQKPRLDDLLFLSGNTEF